MNRGELVDQVHEALAGNFEVPGGVVDALLDAVLRVIVERAACGEKTSFGGLGYFGSATIAARPYVNPRTKEILPVGEEKQRLIFVPSGELKGLLNRAGWCEPAKIKHGQAELLAAALRACDSLDEARRASLNDAGFLCWACDGIGRAGRGAWVQDAGGVWVCASGSPPFLSLGSEFVGLALDYFEGMIKAALYVGGVVRLSGFGEWSVLARSARTVRVPLWSGGSGTADCPASKVVRFSAFGRP